jgi:hypothetical protein
MRRRMLRPHVEDELVGVKKGFVLGIEVEVIGDPRTTLARLCVAIIVFEIAHCPLSMPRLIFTHSWSCWRMG